MQRPFQGSYVALPTPFRDGRLDQEAFAALIEFHAEHDTDGLVVVGTTGEAATLNDFEKRSLIHSALDLSRGRMQVIAGVGTNCTRASIELARFASACGVDGVMAVTPYYNRPSRNGLLGHFGRIADAIEVPLVLYNVPSRTGCDLLPGVARELAERHENVVAIKEASGSVQRLKELVHDTPLDVLCGEDPLTRVALGIGAVGVVGVAANVMPDEVAELIRCSAPGGDGERARELDEQLAPLFRDLFIETNPVPVKAALALLGFGRADVRGPLAPLEAESRAQLAATLRGLDLPLVRPEPVGL